MKLINLTSHVITLAGLPSIPAAEKPLRLKEARSIKFATIEVAGQKLRLIIDTKKYDRIDLPEPVENTGYVVSYPVAEVAWAAGRIDFFTPSQLLRESGEVIGCERLQGSPSWQFALQELD